MKLNDPFGRMEKRHQAGYQAVRDSLQRSGVDSEEAALQVIANTGKRALVFIGASAIVAALTALVFPGAFLLVSAFSLLLSAFVISWTINGRRYINRYIEEDIRAPLKPEGAEIEDDPSIKDDH